MSAGRELSSEQCLSLDYEFFGEKSAKNKQVLFK